MLLTVVSEDLEGVEVNNETSFSMLGIEFVGNEAKFIKAGDQEEQRQTCSWCDGGGRDCFFIGRAW